MTTHIQQALIEQMMAAIAENAMTARIRHRVVLYDETLLPPGVPLPLYGFMDGGTVYEHGSGQDAIQQVAILAYQEIALDERNAPGMMGYGSLTAPTIRQKGILRMLQEVHDVLNRQALPGYWKGFLIDEDPTKLLEVETVNADGSEVAHRCWAVYKKAVYQYTKMT